MHALKNLLIIFYKNPEVGAVKTRLAATLGKEKALDIYLKLADHTRIISKYIEADKVVYYSNTIQTEDAWSSSVFGKKVQVGDDLGERMLNAFQQSFEMGYKQVCIIGTDCLELDADIIEQAFNDLTSNEIALGLAKDGGYYLLGMKRLHPHLFQDKQWSTSTVGHDTLLDILHKKLSYKLLPLLSDIDVEEDLKGKFV